MQRRNLLALATAAVLASQAFAAGVEHTDTGSRAQSSATSTERGTRASADADIGQLLASGLAAVAPADGDFLRRVYELGWTLDTVIDDRVDTDVPAYAARRAQELRTSSDPVARWAAERIAACKADQLCIFQFAAREAVGMQIQTAHMSFYPTFAEGTVGARRRIQSAAYYTAWMPSVIHTARIANTVESKLAAEMQTLGPMSLEDRRLKLVQLYFDLPLEMLTQPRGDDRGATVHGQMGSPYVFYFNGQNYTANDKGIFVFSGGGTYFGGGYAGGVRHAYSDTASGSRTSSSTNTRTTTTGRRSATLE